MRVMYVASNPEDADALQIEQEITGMQERLERGAGADPIELRSYPNLSVSDLAEKVRIFRPDVLHFAAHRIHDALAPPVEGHVRLDGRKLGALLSGLAIRPRLVVLNACESNGMAADLVATNTVDFAIGTDAPITNNGARAMAASLYQRLADGASLATAFAVARTNLNLIDGGAVDAHLHPGILSEAAESTRLVDPLRILAYFPVVDEWLDNGAVEPGTGFRPDEPEVAFGVSGSPAAARQTVLFTDDESVTEDDDTSLEEARSWIIETQPVKGEIWMSYAPALDLTQP